MTTEEKSKIESALMKECHDSMNVAISLLSVFSLVLLLFLFMATHPSINHPLNINYLFFGCFPVLIGLLCFIWYILWRHDSKLENMKKKQEDFTEKEMRISLKLPLE